MIVSLSQRARLAVLLAAIGGLLFDGVELGLMPVASLSVSQDLLGADYTPTLGGDWFARFTAALMLGAAVGGILLGNLGAVLAASPGAAARQVEAVSARHAASKRRTWRVWSVVLMGFISTLLSADN